jgi:hypothetical protein
VLLFGLACPGGAPWTDAVDAEAPAAASAHQPQAATAAKLERRRSGTGLVPGCLAINGPRDLSADPTLCGNE